MNFFITGATGYVGSNLIPRLLQDDHDITCLLRYPEKHTETEFLKRCQIISGDVTDKNSLKGRMDHADYVIHLAVATPLTNQAEDATHYLNVNVLGTRNILDACRDANPERIICFSSTAAIGRPKTEIIDENTPLTPVNPYGESKKLADELIQSYVKKYNMPVTTICFPHIYGPGEIHELFKVIKMIKKGIFPQVGVNPNYLPLVYVSDAIDGILLALKNGKTGEKYIIADDDPHDTRVLRRHVLSCLGIRRKFYPFVPINMGIMGAFILDKLFKAVGLAAPVKAANIRSIVAARQLCVDKSKQDLQFYPQINLKTGIELTIQWYKEQNLI